MNDFDKMKNAVEIIDCPCCSFVEADTFITDPEDDQDRMEVCLWPSFHSDIINLKQTGEYRLTPMGQLTADELPTRAGALRQWQNRLLDQDGVVEKCEKRATDVVTYLSKGLKEGVYKPADLKVLGHVRNVLDLKTLAVNVKSSGAVQVANLNCAKFIKSSEAIYPEVILKKTLKKLGFPFCHFYRFVTK